MSTLAQALAQRGISVDVIVPGVRTARHQYREQPEISVLRFRIVSGAPHYSVSPGLWRYLHRAAKTYDLVHAHNYHALPALAAALSGARPLVVTPHYHGTGHSALGRVASMPYRRAGRIIFDRADAVICVSQAEATLLARHFPRAAAKTTVIPNGIDFDALRAARPLSRPGPLLLTAGRLERYKRVDLVVEAMRYLPGEWHLCVIGEGPERRGLERRAASLGLGGRVSFVDHVEDDLFRRWLKTAAVYVSMSAHEAFGLTVAEAVAAGAGLVASDIHAHREVVSLLGTKRFELLADGSGLGLAQAIMKTGRQPHDLVHSEPLSWRRVAERTLELYETVVARAP